MFPQVTSQAFLVLMRDEWSKKLKTKEVFHLDFQIWKKILRIKENVKVRNYGSKKQHKTDYYHDYSFLSITLPFFGF